MARTLTKPTIASQSIRAWKRAMKCDSSDIACKLVSCSKSHVECRHCVVAGCDTRAQFVESVLAGLRAENARKRANRKPKDRKDKILDEDIITTATIQPIAAPKNETIDAGIVAETRSWRESSSYIEWRKRNSHIYGDPTVECKTADDTYVIHENKTATSASMASEIGYMMGTQWREDMSAVDVSDQAKKPLGLKTDTGKPRWSLIPYDALLEIVKVLTFGATKYSDNNWQHVDNHEDRYFSAMMRHLTAWKNGQRTDDETGLSHLAHAGCCLLFLLWFEVRK